MAIKVQCPNCGKFFSAPDSYHHKKMKCLGCGTKFEAVTVEEASLEVIDETPVDYRSPVIGTNEAIVSKEEITLQSVNEEKAMGGLYVLGCGLVIVVNLLLLWCTIVAFIGGTLPIFGVHVEGGFWFGILWLFIIDPLLTWLVYLVSMGVFVPLTLLLSKIASPVLSYAVGVSLLALVAAVSIITVLPEKKTGLRGIEDPDIRRVARRAMQVLEREDVESLEHFANSKEANQDAMAMLIMGAVRQQIPENTLARILNLQKKALSEAVKVQDSTLRKLHPDLPYHYTQEYIRSIEIYVESYEQENFDKLTESIALYDLWANWWNQHWQQMPVSK